MVDTEYTRRTYVLHENTIAVTIISGKDRIKRTHSIAHHVKKDQQRHRQVIVQYQTQQLIKYNSHAKTSLDTTKYVGRLP